MPHVFWGEAPALLRAAAHAVLGRGPCARLGPPNPGARPPSLRWRIVMHPYGGLRVGVGDPSTRVECTSGLLTDSKLR